MKTHSSKNMVRCSDGTKLSRAQLEVKIRQAKKLKLAQFIAEHGYCFCEDCLRNDCKPIDCSHNISVDKCTKTGMAEKAFSIDNITLRGRACHRKHDGLE